MDEVHFLKTADVVITSAHQSGSSVPAGGGIGTLGEKLLHRIIKFYLESDESRHEVPVGPYVADICSEGKITEVQTGHFYPLIRKLDYYLGKYRVEIVHPLLSSIQLNWVDPESGEVVSRRRSNKRESIFDAARELYVLRNYLEKAGLSFRFLLLEVSDYRLLDGYGRDRKKRATRYERLPLRLADEIYIGGSPDYACLLPEQLTGEFTSQDYSKTARVRIDTARMALNLLERAGVCEMTGFRQRRKVFRVSGG